MNFLFKKYMLASLVLSQVLLASAQADALSIGSSFPSITLENIVNAPYEKLNLKQVGNKPILLEFWSTRCAVCLKKIYDLAAIQKEFKNELQIMTATPETREMVKSLYQKMPELKALGIPSAVDDKILIKLFPAKTVPHMIWIGRDRKVKAITGNKEVTRENISRFVNNESLADLPVKRDLVDFDVETQPLLLNGPVVSDQIFQSSVLTGEIVGGPSSRGIHKLNSNNQIVCLNQNIIGLYSFAYRYNITLTPASYAKLISVKTRQIDTAISSKTLPLYCYELLMHNADKQDQFREQVFGAMQKDLDRLFQIQSSVQKLFRPAYVLIPLSREWHYNEQSYKIIPHKDTTDYQNVEIRIVLAHIEAAYSFDLPVVYEGLLDNKISIALPNTIKSIQEVKDVLQRVGYTLKRENRWIETLVLE